MHYDLGMERVHPIYPWIMDNDVLLTINWAALFFFQKSRQFAPMSIFLPLLRQSGSLQGHREGRGGGSTSICTKADWSTALPQAQISTTTRPLGYTFQCSKWPLPILCAVSPDRCIQKMNLMSCVFFLLWLYLKSVYKTLLEWQFIIIFIVF